MVEFGEFATGREIAGMLGELGAVALPLNSSSPAYENARLVKGGTGTLFGVTGYNSKASAQFVQLHDALVLPGDGAVPVCFFTVAATSNFAVFWGNYGRSFNAGLWLCNSSTGPTKTIGSADVFFDCQYV